MAPPFCPKCSIQADDTDAKFCECCGSAMSELSFAPTAKKLNGCPCCGSAPKRLDSEGFCQECGKRAPNALPSDSEGGEAWEADSKLAHFTHVGRRHHINQDAATAMRLDSICLMAVADGVSSSQHGEEASAAAVAAWLKAARDATLAGQSPSDAMKLGFLAAQSAATALDYNPSLALDEPETTLVAAIAYGSKACIGWVGDSRAYAIADADGSGRLLTRDDSWLASALDAGMDEDKANADPRSHAITQCLGTRDEDPEAHIQDFELASGESLLLCSDGLWNYYPGAEQIAASATAHPDSALETCRELCGRANAAGGRDNVTVALLRR